MRLYISIGIALLGAILLVSPETLIAKDSSNQQLKMVYDNSMIIGMGLLVVAIYTMKATQAAPGKPVETTTEMSNVSD